MFHPSRLRATVVAGPLAFLATAAVVGIGVLGAETGGASFLADSTVGDVTTRATDAAGLERAPAVSRSTSRRDAQADDTAAGTAAETAAGAAARRGPAELSRVETLMQPAAVREAVREADTVMWSTVALNLWDVPGDDATVMGELDEGKKVTVTGRSLYGRDEIVVGQRTRWVTSGYFSDEKPAAPVIGADCTNGTSVASGVSPNIVKVHQAVCAAFPDIGVYGTFRSDGEHAQGIAVDIMVSGEEGYAVADFVRANYAELGVNYVIYSQRIWSVDRSGEGWRAMEDRGSVTANHYDHVHVTTY